MKNKLLLTLLLLVGCQQSFQSKLLNNVITLKDSIEVLDSDVQHDRIQRDLSDMWNKIRSKIFSAWEAFKNITSNTKKHIKEYVQKIKVKIQLITKVYENKLENLKKEFKNIIEHAIATGEIVKICIKEDKKVIETLLKKIFINVATCISNNIKFMADIDNNIISHNSLDTDDSVFLNSVENKMKTSLETCDKNMDQCLNNVKEEVLADINIATWNVSQKAFEVKNAADDGLDVVVACVTEALTIASTAITNETIQIIKCVKNKE